MGPGIPELEGECQLHDVIPLDVGITYLENKGHQEAVKQLKETAEEYNSKTTQTFKGSGEMGACRKQFGTSVVSILNEMSASERKKVHAFDSDLEGSVGLTAVRENYPECFTKGGNT